MMAGYHDDPQAHVAHFIEAFHLLSSSVLLSLPDLSGLSDVVRAARGRQIQRQGVLEGGLQYQVHGMGCVMIGADDAIVNVDFLPDGRAIFDVTRLEDFIRSTDRDSSVSRAELLAACRLAVSEGLVGEASGDWFVVPGRLRSNPD